MQRTELLYTPIFDKIEETEGALEIGLWDDRIAYGATDQAAKEINEFIKVLGIEATIHHAEKENKAKIYHIDYLSVLDRMPLHEAVSRIELQHLF